MNTPIQVDRVKIIRSEEERNVKTVVHFGALFRRVSARCGYFRNPGEQIQPEWPYSSDALRGKGVSARTLKELKEDQCIGRKACPQEHSRITVHRDFKAGSLHRVHQRIRFRKWQRIGNQSNIRSPRFEGSWFDGMYFPRSRFPAHPRFTYAQCLSVPLSEPPGLKHSVSLPKNGPRASSVK